MLESQEHFVGERLNSDRMQDLKTIRFLHIKKLRPSKHLYRQQDLQTYWSVQCRIQGDRESRSVYGGQGIEVYQGEHPRQVENCGRVAARASQRHTVIDPIDHVVHLKRPHTQGHGHPLEFMVFLQLPCQSVADHQPNFHFSATLRIVQGKIWTHGGSIVLVEYGAF